MEKIPQPGSKFHRSDGFVARVYGFKHPAVENVVKAEPEAVPGLKRIGDVRVGHGKIVIIIQRINLVAAAVSHRRAADGGQLQKFPAGFFAGQSNASGIRGAAVGKCNLALRSGQSKKDHKDQKNRREQSFQHKNLSKTAPQGASDTRNTIQYRRLGYKFYKTILPACKGVIKKKSILRPCLQIAFNKKSLSTGLNVPPLLRFPL